jgi:hypothetical protein
LCTSMEEITRICNVANARHTLWRRRPSKDKGGDQYSQAAEETENHKHPAMLTCEAIDHTHACDPAKCRR